MPEFISFDHDLGKGLKKGALCAAWLKQYCEKNGLNLPNFYSHSANSHGRKKINSILSGNGEMVNEENTVDEWGRPTVYHDDDKLELVKDINVKNGGNFPIKRGGKEYWVSRSNSISLYVFSKDENNEWNVLASKRGKNSKFSPGLWNVVCGFLDYGYTLESTAVKEAFEETGVKIPKQSLKCLGTNSSRTRGPVNTSFFCVMPKRTSSYPTNIANSEPGEVDEARWVPLSRVGELQWMSNQGEKAVSLAEKYLSSNEEELGGNVWQAVRFLNQALDNGEIDEVRYKAILKNLYNKALDEIKKKEVFVMNENTELKMDDFLDTYKDEKEATFMYELAELVFEASRILSNIKDLVEGSDYAVECRDKVKPYVEKVAEVIEKMDDFLY